MTYEIAIGPNAFMKSPTAEKTPCIVPCFIGPNIFEKMMSKLVSQYGIAVPKQKISATR